MTPMNSQPTTPPYLTFQKEMEDKNSPYPKLLEPVDLGWGIQPLTVYPWYLLCSLGIIGDNLPMNTHYIYRASIGIYHDGIRWARGTSLPIP